MREGAKARAREAAGHIRRQYGLTPDQFHNLLIHHAGRCAICRQPMKQPCVDHDHTTGAVRGLLCRDCNLGLGYLERSGFMVAADEYLRHYSGLHIGRSA